MNLNLKKLLPALAGILLSGLTMGQSQRCSVLEHEHYLEQKNPKRQQQRAAFNQQLNEWMSANSSANKSATTQVTIPVVVHVVYKTATQNISDAQILSQIEILNQDFNRLNADTVNTPAPWKSIGGNAQVTFCMAQIDPSGNPTNGIERRNTTVNSFGTNDNIKSYASGGLDAWDPSQYFNIWVGSLSGGLLGYAEFPTGTLSNTYGVVIGYNYFGNIGTATSPFDLGRTATHEIGHCFNLFHIWGDDGSGCTGSDQVNDTPNQGSLNYGCPSFPHTDACSPNPPGVMFMNYMDYTDDACMNIFTQGQVSRMLAVINSAPYNALTTSTACGVPVLQTTDAMMAAISSPVGVICNNTFTPEISLKNKGVDTLTSVDIHYSVDGISPLVYSWSGSLPSLASVNITLPSVTTTAGAHTFIVYTDLPNGVSDLDNTNDTATAVFTVVNSGLPLPYSEGFESGVPPTGGSINNADGSLTWEQTNAANHSGSFSAYINNFDYNAHGLIDEIVLPGVDLTGQANPQLTFWLAYRLFTSTTANPNYSDTLEVLISTDCGDSYTSIYRKYSTALVTTGTPYNIATAFVPTAAQWRNDTIDLTAYTNNANIVLKFRNITDFENNLYLDDINIQNAATTGVGELNNTSVHLYPNPASNSIQLDLSRLNETGLRLRIYDLTGRTLLDEKGVAGGYQYEYNLSSLSSGSYFLEITGANTLEVLPFIKK